MDVFVLGEFEVRDGDAVLDVGGGRSRTLLALLVANLGETVSADTLIDGIWGDDLPRRPRKALQVLVSNLRKVLGDRATITTGPAGYRLEAAGLTVDSVAFAAELAQGRAADGAGLALVESALGKWHGPPYAGVTSDALVPEIQRLTEMHAAAEETRAALLIEAGRVGEAVTLLERLVAAAPLRETRWELLVRALYQHGRQADALRALGRMRQILAEELGIEPSPALAALEQQILEQDPALVAADLAANPYRGLLAFGEDDTDLFFGREEFVGRLVARAASERFVALVGPSGSGKSSVLAAGLVPAIRRGLAPGSAGWKLVTMRPGADPWRELAAALDGPTTSDAVTVEDLIPHSGDLVLVLDQAEELFTTARPEDATRFLAELAGVVNAGRLRVFTAVRGDFYDRLLADPSLGPMLVDGTLPVPPLSPEEIARAIVGPAERVGARVEAGLVELLVADARQEPGALPLLQFVLAEMYVIGEGSLTADAYHKLGGLTGALAQRADSLYASLTPAEQDALRNVLLRLVALGEGTRDTRRRALRSELSALDPHADLVIDELASRRLLALDRDRLSGQPTVDLAHEALLSSWQRFAGWIDQARVDLRRQRDLRQAALEWDAAGRDPAFLLTGGRLARFAEWEPTATIALTGVEQDFLAASIDGQRAKEKAERRQAERELRLERAARRRLAAAATVLAAGVVAAGLLALVAFRQTQNANTQRAAAESLQVVAEERRVEAEQQRAEAERQQALVEQDLAEFEAQQRAETAQQVRAGDPELAALLAMEAMEAAAEAGIPLDDAVSALHLALQDLNVRFPPNLFDEAVVPAPEGFRAVFIMPLREVIHLALSEIDRSLTAAECAQYLDGACPVTTVDQRLAPDVLASSILEAERSFPPLAGTRAVFEDFRFAPGLGSFGQGAAIWDAELARFRRASGVLVELPNTQSDVEDVISIPAAAVTSRDPVVTEAIPAAEIARAADLARNAPRHMRDLLMVDGVQIASWTYYQPLTTVWYREQVFDELGLAAPATWDELVGVTATIAAAGVAPWCLGLAGNLATMSPLAAVEGYLLAAGGVGLFDRWLDGSVPMTDPRVVAAHRAAGDLLFSETASGPRNRVLATAANDPRFFLADDPVCAMWLLPPAWAQGFNQLESDPRAVGVFLLPTGPVGSTQPMVVDGNVTVMKTDRPESRAMLTAFTSSQFGRNIAGSRLNTNIVANPRLELTGYRDSDSRFLAEAILAAADEDLLRPGYLVQNPHISEAYRDAVRRWYAEGPESLESVLADLEQTRQELSG